MSYRPPLAGMRFAADPIGQARLADTARFAEASVETRDAILDEAGRLARDLLAPLDALGDRPGSRLENGVVRTPPGFAAAHRALAESMVHLVLARLPGAAPGTRGISLFAVPEFWPEKDGRPGAPNAVRPVGLETKLGLHASPTCVLAHERARGWLIGAEDSGMAAMQGAAPLYARPAASFGA